MFRYRDKATAEKILGKLREMKLKIRLMHVCGTHQDTIVHYGLDNLLKQCGVEVRQGPGCPVCVTTQREFEEAAALAMKGKIIAAFGDVARVPVQGRSLLELRGEGCDVKVVYSVEDAVSIANKTEKDVVFMAIGFETTAPSTAATILSDPPGNLAFLPCHRYVPPVLHKLLTMGELRLNGLIEPGHVSTVIGVKPYEPFSKQYRVPQVVAGFEPLDVMMAVYMLAIQIKNGEAKVENEYTRSVRYEGNPKAIETMNEVFEPQSLDWRGFPNVPNSGMKLRSRFQQYDARKRFEDELKELEKESKEPEGCRCGEMLRGLIDPADCSLFGRVCTPQQPVGPCMVSIEGACNIEYKYRGLKPKSD